MKIGASAKLEKSVSEKDSNMLLYATKKGGGGGLKPGIPETPSLILL